jgi:hypothetical protein
MIGPIPGTLISAARNRHPGAQQPLHEQIEIMQEAAE